MSVDYLCITIRAQSVRVLFWVLASCSGYTSGRFRGTYKVLFHTELFWLGECRSDKEKSFVFCIKVMRQFGPSR
jgi:hypothetical protein